MRGWGSHRSARRHIRSQVIRLRWLRRRSALQPVPDDPSAEGVERLDVVGHRVVVVVPAQDAGEPASLLGDRAMHAPPHLGLDRVSFARTRFLLVTRFSLNRPVPGLRADVRETQKLERLRLTEPTRLALGRRTARTRSAASCRHPAPTELREPVAQIGQEPLGVLTMLEAHHVVIGEPHDDHHPRARAAASTGRPTGRTRSAGRRSQAAAKPMPLAARPPRTPTTPRPR